jgi:hypothetical protein
MGSDPYLADLQLTSVDLEAQTIDVLSINSAGSQTNPVSEMQMKVVLVMACIFLSASLCQGDCVKNARGKTVCSDGKSAAAYNPNTGKGATANKNSNGVTNTQTTNGGKSTTKNGKGVATGPNGTTCAKGYNNAGCTPPK